MNPIEEALIFMPGGCIRVLMLGPPRVRQKFPSVAAEKDHFMQSLRINRPADSAGYSVFQK